MLTAVQLIFWLGIGAVATTYGIYPVVLCFAQSRRRTRTIPNAPLPHVTLVISAYNEAGVIREKIENSLALDYPADRLEIMVISDGSDDGTNEIAREYAHRGVVLRRQEPRGGKSLGLTRFVPRARGEVIVFSDANAMYEPDAIRKLVRHFGDEKVGFVVGHQRYVEEGSPASSSESLYWRYETAIKVWEGRVGSVVCGDGAIYAIRSELFEPLREDDINDFYLPLRIVAKGYRGVFDEEAICYERTAEDFAGEFRRKARIVNRSLRAVIRVPAALNPFRVGVFAFQLFLHKVLRWFVPVFLLAALVSSGWLAFYGRVPFYQLLFVAQLVFYANAAAHVLPGIRELKPVYVAYYFCVVNAAAVWGVLGCLFGRKISVWQPERSAVPVKESVSA